MLIVDDLSRLTRNSVEAERTIRRLEFNGIRIISTSDGYDSTSAAPAAVIGMVGPVRIGYAFAETRSSAHCSGRFAPSYSLPSAAGGWQRKMHTAYAERLKVNAQRVELMPQEIAALDDRLERLRERLKNGDLDMTPDELQATIERVEAKRRELTTAATRAVTGDGAKILSLLSKAAEYYGQQIALGLDGDLRAAATARPHRAQTS